MVTLKKGRGFTLIELLVVIAIIGILATIMLIQFSGVPASGRDAKRVGHMSQMQTALALYANDNNDQYPGSAANTWYSDCGGVDSLEAEIGDDLEDSFTQFPHDPLFPETDANICYRYKKGPGSVNCGGEVVDLKGYVLVFASERKDFSNSYPLFGATDNRYCIIN